MQEAEVTHPSIATRQDVDHQPPKELDQRQRAQPLLPGLVVLIAEGDGLRAGVIGDDLLFRDHPSVEITREVLECWQALTDVPALHGWRRQVFGEDALKLRQGRSALALRGKKLALVDVSVADDGSRSVRPSQAAAQSYAE